jgi:hypothetical protein
MTHPSTYGPSLSPTQQKKRTRALIHEARMKRQLVEEMVWQILHPKKEEQA